VATNPHGQPVDAVDECKHDVAVAAQEEREAQEALFAASKREPSAEDDGRRALLHRWQAAARSLAVALENLGRAQRSRDVLRRHPDDLPPG
jgi:hypothetical protein